MYTDGRVVGTMPAAALSCGAGSHQAIWLHRSGHRFCGLWQHALPRQGRAQRGPAVVCAREPPRMRNLRGGGGPTAASPQYGSLNGVPTAPGSGAPTTGQTMYRGNLSGPSTNMEATTAVRPDDVLAASRTGNTAAAAAVATGSQPVVKFVPKRISLWDAMKFNGPAPEIINGRLAMVGFVTGVVRETQTSETLLQQAAHLSPWTVVWLLLIVVASLQPITRAAKSEPFGWFTPRAEITNARAAMLGFAIVAALEWKAGVCFF